MSTWLADVTFEEQSSVSVITYGTGPAATRQLRKDLLVKISNVLANFSTAVSAVQSAGLCCNSFTVLLLTHGCLELRRIELRHARMMLSHIGVAPQGNNSGKAVSHCVGSAVRILRELEMPIPDTGPDSDLHCCSLTAQFLCTAFLSYIQAHIGSINPFFLDTPERKLVLLGSQPGEFVISAELVELTCLAEMTQQPVLAFSIEAPNRQLRLEGSTFRYDIRTNAEDCLDTWGPGYLIHNKAHPSKIHAVAIGGGFVALVDSQDSRFHWAKGKLSESVSQATFEKDTTMRISAAVSVNAQCCMNEAV